MNIDIFLHAYIVAALWSTNDDDGNPLDDRFSPDDIEPATLAAMRADCEKFIAENADDLSAYAETQAHGEWAGEDLAGHDFWLTRNGHGCGFWDRGLGELGDRLSDAACAYGEVYLYVSDDGKVCA